MTTSNQPSDGILWDGFCPQCAIDNKQSKMRLNNLDFFECEQCKLQMVLSSGLVAIADFRGKAIYRRLPDYAHLNDRYEFLSPMTIKSYPWTNKYFKSKDELNQFIKAIR